MSPQNAMQVIPLLFFRYAGLLVSLLLWSKSAFACEGECITGITNAFLTNYTIPVHSSLALVAEDVISRCVPNWNPQQDSVPALSYFTPFLTAYQNIAFERLKQNIFPDFFHGKCERSDSGGPPVNPLGCPNPNCPVVCGTPGSLVHFYSKLRYIAFKSTKTALRDVTKPGSPAYKEVQRALKMTTSMKARSASASLRRLVLHRRAEENIQTTCNLKEVGRMIGSALEKGCGGSGSGVTNGLPLCSWAEPMKQFILTFP